MEIWLDTIDLEIIADAVKTGIISGITTNPSILSYAKDPFETIKRLLDLQPGPVAVQVTSQDVENMTEEAYAISSLSPRMIVKIPVNYNGLLAMKALKGIPILGTTILYPSQALLARQHELDYIAPYFSHMGENAQETLKKMIELLNGSKTKTLVASIKEVDHVVACALLGAEAVTIKSDLYRKLVENQASIGKFLEKFDSDWKQRHGKKSIKYAFQATVSS